jgi:acyl-CoA thioester hydrolase
MSTITYKGLVMANETDSNQHMNVQFYTRKYDEATGILLTHVGTIKDLKQKNWGMAHIESNIKYLKEVLEDEALHILSKIVSISNKVITIEHEMYNTGKNELASTATFKLVFLDLKTRRAVTIPTEIKAKIEAIK